jgi:Tfp pilus assembly PilM family ATPase
MEETDEGNVIKALKKDRYPFVFSYHLVFDEINLKILAAFIREFSDKVPIQISGLKISLPNNFVLTNRVTIPINAQTETIREQVRWELETLLPEPIQNYKIIKKEIEFEFDAHSELVIVCIHKLAIQKMNQLANLSNLALTELWVDSFSIDNYLRNSKMIHTESNQIVFKANETNLTTHLFLQGKYYGTQFDIYTADNSRVDLVNTIRSKYNSILNQLEMISNIGANSFQLFLIKDIVTSDLMKELNELINNSFIQLPTQTIPDVDMEQAGTVEALGVLDYQFNQS